MFDLRFEHFEFTSAKKFIHKVSVKIFEVYYEVNRTKIDIKIYIIKVNFEHLNRLRSENGLIKKAKLKI